MAASLFEGVLFWIIIPAFLTAIVLNFQGPSVNVQHVQCSLLSLLLPGKVSYSNSDLYISSIRSYWSLHESAIQPTCIITPDNTADVATIVRYISYLNHITVCKFAIRGGGHTPWAGSANMEGGITIDMRRINSISVNRDRSEASIGAGAIWGDVHREMDRLGLSVVGGRAASVGVGGLLTGGGISYFSARKGFACDNIVNYEVVLASGQVVNANAKTFSDLWNALKGGSNNFGIVTRFDLKPFDQGDFLGGTIVYDDIASTRLLEAFIDLNRDKGYDEYAAVIQSHSYIVGAGFVASANIEYTKAESDPLSLRPFLQSQPQYTNSMRISNQTDFTVEFIEHQPNGRRQSYTTATFKNDLDLLKYAYNTMKEVATELASATGVTLSITFQPIPPAITSKSAALGGNMMGLKSEEGAQILCLISATWDSEDHDHLISAVAQKIHDRIVAKAKAKGLWNRWIYLNYADSWQDPIKGYGMTNRQKLQDVSKRYDPSGLFQKTCPGGFKLF